MGTCVYVWGWGGLVCVCVRGDMSLLRRQGLGGTCVCVWVGGVGVRVCAWGYDFVEEAGVYVCVYVCVCVCG